MMKNVFIGGDLNVYIGNEVGTLKEFMEVRDME